VAAVAAPVGRVNGALDERAIRLRGRLSNPAEFENLVVNSLELAPDMCLQLPIQRHVSALR